MTDEPMNGEWDDDDRAIARALDAASEAETAGADEQLVDEYRDVLAAMPFSEVAPPVDLEDRIVAAALERRPATVPTIAGRRARSYRGVRVAALAVVTVAAAIVIGLIVNNGSSGQPAPNGQVSLATAQRADVDAWRRSPGARTATFVPPVGQVVITTSGDGAVYALTDPRPVSIGLVSKGGTTVIGPAKPAAGAVAFSVDHPERVTAVTLIRNGAEIARAELSSN